MGLKIHATGIVKGASASRVKRIIAASNLVVVGLAALVDAPPTLSQGQTGSAAQVVSAAAATAGNVVVNGSASSDIAGWTTNSASGGITLRRVTDLGVGVQGSTTGIAVSRSGGAGDWAFALAPLKTPETSIVVGKTYRMSAWVKDVAASGTTIGFLLANGNYQHRPTDTSDYVSFRDSSWHLISRTFVSTAPAFADTSLYVALPGAGNFDFRMTKLGVEELPAAPPIVATVTTTPRTINFAGSAGSPPDPNVWNYAVGGHGWGNGELQTYTNRTSNVQNDGKGKLKITARRETLAGPDGIKRDYTSARVTTKDKVSIPAGSYVESSITAPTGAGVWPAFWTLGANIDAVGWPMSGELDIMEGVGAKPTLSHAAVHMAAQANSGSDLQYGWGEAGGTTDLKTPIDTMAHRYGVYFDGNIVRFYIDRKPTMTLLASDALRTGRTWPFDKSQYLLLNVAVSPNDDASRTVFPRTMTVGPISIWSGGTPF